MTQLRAAGGAHPPLLRLEHWIAEQGMHAEEAAARATQRVALTQLMMANSITSLRGIARMDWEVFVERQSAMEAVLRRDPAGVYAGMTFETRDQYRHVVERIAKRIRAGRAGRGAATRSTWRRGAQPTAPRTRPPAPRRLLPGGRRARPSWSSAAGSVRRAPLAALPLGDCATRTWSSSGACSPAPSPPSRRVLWLAGPAARAAWPLVLLFAFIPANDIAVSAMNQLVTAFLPPRRLPKLDLVRHGGVPAELRTAVVVPTLFGSVEAVREALEHLEVQFLANREAHLHFAVLSDFTDAPTETRDDDAGDRGGRGARASARSTPGTATGEDAVLPVPPAAALEPEPGRVDGLGAEARQAGRVQPLPARRRAARRSRASWATSRRSAACAT